MSVITDNRDIKFKDKAKETLIGSQSEIILLGIPVNEYIKKPKATYFQFTDNDEHYLYYFKDDTHTVARLPENTQGVTSYYSDFRIYDDTGICYTFHNPYPDEPVQILSEGKHLYVRNLYVKISDTYKQKN